MFLLLSTLAWSSRDEIWEVCLIVVSPWSNPSWWFFFFDEDSEQEKEKKRRRRSTSEGLLSGNLSLINVSRF